MYLEQLKKGWNFPGGREITERHSKYCHIQCSFTVNSAVMPKEDQTMKKQTPETDSEQVKPALEFSDKNPKT